jgi:hypothetical protein
MAAFLSVLPASPASNSTVLIAFLSFAAVFREVVTAVPFAAVDPPELVLRRHSPTAFSTGPKRGSKACSGSL